MSKADEMFKELGYVKVYEDELEIKYVYKSSELGDDFEFILLFTKISKLIFHKDENCRTIGIELKLLQAINEKCKELQWI